MPCNSNPLKNRISTDQRRQMATATLADVGFFDVFAHQLRQAVGAEPFALLGQEQNAIAQPHYKMAPDVIAVKRCKNTDIRPMSA